MWTEANIPTFFGFAAAYLAYAYAQCHRAADALSLIEQVVGLTDVGVARHPPDVLHGDTYFLVGRLEDARTRALCTLEDSRNHKQHGHQAWALRLLGDIAAHRRPRDVAQAEALADELGMRPLQAHLHLSLGRLHRSENKIDEARRELSLALASYRGMEMPAWIAAVERELAACGAH